MFSMLQLTKDYTKVLEKRLKALEDMGKIRVGVFGDQGDHWSGMTFPQLLQLQSRGSRPKKIPPRPVLEIAYAFYPLKRSPLKKSLHRYLSNLKGVPETSLDQVFINYGNFYQNKTKELFGDLSVLEPNSPYTVKKKIKAGVQGQNPLIFRGDLRDAITYRYKYKW